MMNDPDLEIAKLQKQKDDLSLKGLSVRHDIAVHRVEQASVHLSELSSGRDQYTAVRIDAQQKQEVFERKYHRELDELEEGRRAFEREAQVQRQALDAWHQANGLHGLRQALDRDVQYALNRMLFECYNKDREIRDLKLIIEACKTGDLPKIRELLSFDSPLKQPLTRWYPLHIAAFYGHDEVLAFLLEAGFMDGLWKGHLAIDLARLSGHAYCEKLLSEKSMIPREIISSDFNLPQDYKMDPFYKMFCSYSKAEKIQLYKYNNEDIRHKIRRFMDNGATVNVNPRALGGSHQSWFSIDQGIPTMDAWEIYRMPVRKGKGVIEVWQKDPTNKTRYSFDTSNYQLAEGDYQAWLFKNHVFCTLWDVPLCSPGLTHLRIVTSETNCNPMHQIRVVDNTVYRNAFKKQYYVGEECVVNLRSAVFGKIEVSREGTVISSIDLNAQDKVSIKIEGEGQYKVKGIFYSQGRNPKIERRHEHEFQAKLPPLAWVPETIPAWEKLSLRFYPPFTGKVWLKRDGDPISDWENLTDATPFECALTKVGRATLVFDAEKPLKRVYQTEIEVLPGNCFKVQPPTEINAGEPFKLQFKCPLNVMVTLKCDEGSVVFFKDEVEEIPIPLDFYTAMNVKMDLLITNPETFSDEEEHAESLSLSVKPRNSSTALQDLRSQPAFDVFEEVFQEVSKQTEDFFQAMGQEAKELFERQSIRRQHIEQIGQEADQKYHHEQENLDRIEQEQLDQFNQAIIGVHQFYTRIQNDISTMINNVVTTVQEYFRQSTEAYQQNCDQINAVEATICAEIERSISAINQHVEEIQKHNQQKAEYDKAVHKMQKKIKKNKRMAMIRGIGGTIAGMAVAAFAGPALAGFMAKASAFLSKATSLALAKGIIAGGVGGAVAGRKPLQDGLRGGLIGALQSIVGQISSTVLKLPAFRLPSSFQRAAQHAFEMSVPQALDGKSSWKEGFISFASSLATNKIPLPILSESAQATTAALMRGKKLDRSLTTGLLSAVNACASHLGAVSGNKLASLRQRTTDFQQAAVTAEGSRDLTFRYNALRRPAQASQVSDVSPTAQSGQSSQNRTHDIQGTSFRESAALRDRRPTLNYQPQVFQNAATPTHPRSDTIRESTAHTDAPERSISYDPQLENQFSATNIPDILRSEQHAMRPQLSLSQPQMSGQGVEHGGIRVVNDYIKPMGVGVVKGTCNVGKRVVHLVTHLEQLPAGLATIAEDTACVVSGIPTNACVARFNQRLNAVNDWMNTFKSAEVPKQVEMASEVVTEWYLGSKLLPAANHAGRKLLFTGQKLGYSLSPKLKDATANVLHRSFDKATDFLPIAHADSWYWHKVGTRTMTKNGSILFKPRYFWFETHVMKKNRAMLETQRSLLKDARVGFKDSTLSYVINQKKELIIGNEQIEHFYLAKGEPVLAAGDIYLTSTNTGIKIASIDNRSGSFWPKGDHLKELVEKTFFENGYNEAIGKYVNSQISIRSWELFP